MDIILEFFKRDTSQKSLNLFGFEHFFLIFITLACAFLIYYFKDTLKKWEYKNKLRYFLAALFFMNMAVYYLNIILKGAYNWRVHLPLHLCFITGYIFMYILITNNKKLYKIIYFYTFVGPLPAMIWPNTLNRFDRFYTYQFFISHHILLLASLFCLFVLEYNVEIKDSIKAFLTGNILFAFVFVFNIIFKTNYIMTDKIPDYIIKTMPVLAYIKHPLFWLEGMAIVIMLISFVPIMLVNSKTNVEKMQIDPVKI